MKKVMHPGGFQKITLISVFGFRLRAHIWRNFTEEIEDPHEHRWLLLSLPVWGRFQDYRWQEIEGDSHQVFSATPYSQTPGEDHYRSNLTQARRTGLKLVNVWNRRPFVPYHCKSSEIHSYRPVGSGFHMSLVVTVRTSKSAGYVYREREVINA